MEKRLAGQPAMKAQKKCLGGCPVFPDENNIVPDRKYPDCKQEWASVHQIRPLPG